MVNEPPEHDPPPDDAFASPTVPLFSHAGLSAVDPLAPATVSRSRAVWPWGLSGVAEVLDVIILALVMFMAVRFVAHNYVVDGGSMLPTFHDSDFLIVNRLAYRSFDLSWVPGVDEDEWRPFGEPQAGDVIVFIYQQQPQERDFIKRVIAVPGQTVAISGDGVVFVDGRPLDEPYVLEAPPYTGYPPVPEETVQPGMVFVLGDNRNNSFDSHIFGQIEQSSIIGRADFRYWPTDRWGLIDHMLGETVQTVGRKVGGLWP